MTDMDNPQPINLSDDAYFRGLGWKAVSRDADGHAVSSISHGFDDCFVTWKREQAKFGHTVVLLALKGKPAANE